MTMVSGERLDRIIGCVKGNIGIASLYTIGKLISDCKIVRNIYCPDEFIEESIVDNKNIRDIREEIGRGVVNNFYINEKCNLTIQSIYLLRRNNEYIKIADIILKELEKDGIIKIGKDYIAILKDSDNIAKEFERRYGIPWLSVYEIIEGIKRGKSNYTVGRYLLIF